MFALSLFSTDASTDVDASPEATDSISIISEGAKIEGTLEFRSVNVRIEGTVHGDISTDGRVVVAEGAEVQGTITARTIRLAGYVEGELEAESELVLCPPSDVHATLNADILEIQPGANFSGDVSSAEQSPSDDASVPEQNGTALSPTVKEAENGHTEVTSVE